MPNTASDRPPLVTIGLPVYNSQRYLSQSLDSLLAQTFRDFVLIISDNASTDATPDICRKYAELDPRVQYYRNDVNIGNPKNFNRVSLLAATRYLKWSTADDFWAPQFLELAVEVMERDPGIALCYPQAYLVNADASTLEPYNDVLHLVDEDPAARFVAVLERIKLAHQHLGLIRMSCLRRTHLLGTHVGSDVNLLAELALYGKFYELPKRLYYRRFHEKSGSWRRGDAKHDAAYYYGTNERMRLKQWRTHKSSFAAVQRASLPFRSKLRLYRYLGKRMIWDRAKLSNELVAYVRMLLRSKVA
jgi:glycosyltransferase involved in cell wall biosynthesis